LDVTNNKQKGTEFGFKHGGGTKADFVISNVAEPGSRQYGIDIGLNGHAVVEVLKEKMKAEGIWLDSIPAPVSRGNGTRRIVRPSQPAQPGKETQVRTAA
jgi:hypothetical protein